MSEKKVEALYEDSLLCITPDALIFKHFISLAARAP